MLKKISIISLLSFVFYGSSACAEDTKNYVTGSLGYTSTFSIDGQYKTAPVFAASITFPVYETVFLESTVFINSAVRGYLACKLTNSNQNTYMLYGKIGLGVSVDSLKKNDPGTIDSITSDESTQKPSYEMLPSVLLEFGTDYRLKDNLSLNVKGGTAGMMLFAGIGISYYF